MRRQRRSTSCVAAVKIELEEEGDASLGIDGHESSIRVGGMPMALGTSTAAAAAGATTLPCASSPRRSKRKLEGIATAAASAAVNNTSGAMASTGTFQHDAKQPKPGGYGTEQHAGGDALAQKKTSHGATARPEPAAAATARHRKTGRVAVKEEATGAAVKEEAVEAVVKEEEATAAPRAGCSRGGQDNASRGNPVKRERRRVGGARATGTSSSPQTTEPDKKVGKKSPKKADKTVKVKAEEKRGGGENVSRKKIPPRLAEKAALILDVMDALYPDPPIPINHMDSFTLLCGVLLSAQTTDGQVNEVTKELFRVAPDPQSLSKMDQEDVQRIIRSVGLAPTKAKHLIALSQQLLDRFDGRVPDTFEGLQSLPGVGRKTAAVVMVQAFGVPAFPVDTHIHRLALRWGLTKNEKNASKVEEDLKAAFPRDSWAKLHLQFIYFGREHCQARIHDPSACPVCSWVKKTGPGAPKVPSDLTCLRDYLASPTPPKKSSKNAIVYSERLLEMEQFRMKIEEG